jgi:hypothetical protein
MGRFNTGDSMGSFNTGDSMGRFNTGDSMGRFNTGRFFTVNYALRLNLTILRLNKHRFFKIRLYRKGHTVIDRSERHNF